MKYLDLLHICSILNKILLSNKNDLCSVKLNECITQLSLAILFYRINFSLASSDKKLWSGKIDLNKLALIAQI